jgi:hypothetical protein
VQRNDLLWGLVSVPVGGGWLNEVRLLGASLVYVCTCLGYLISERIWRHARLYGVATVTVQADHIPPLVISLRALSLKYSPGDHVKHRFADSLGILSTVDEDRRKVTFVEKDTNEEVRVVVSQYYIINIPLQYLAHMDTVEPYSPHSNFFRFTPGLWVHFRGPRDSERPKRRGYITAVEGAHTRVTDERTFTEVSNKMSSADSTDIGLSSRSPMAEGQLSLVFGPKN